VASLAAIRGVFAQRNAKIFYSGSIVCWTGSWVQRIATDWLAWQLTHSVMWVAIIAFCNLVPSVVVSPIAGAVASSLVRPGTWQDRVRRVLAGSLVGLCCGEAVADVLQFIRESYRLATGFVTGAIGYVGIRLPPPTVGRRFSLPVRDTGRGLRRAVEA
jgi:uncharacterized protein YqgC (DUF456 family)